MENQCYSHEPHWELSKKEVKLAPLRGIEPRKNHYGKPTLSSQTALNNTIMNQTINHLSNQRYPHGRYQ